MREGWRETTLGAVAETRLGKTLPRGSGADVDGQPYLRNVNVQWGRIATQGLNQMEFSPAEREQLRLRAGDILVCEGGEVGRLALVRKDMDGIYFQNALHRVRVVDESTVPEFVALALEHFVRSGGLDGITTRVTIAHLNQSKLRALPLLLPPLDEQRRIVDLIGTLDETIAAAERLKRRLSIALAKRRDMVFSQGETRSAGEMFDILMGLQRSPARAEGPDQTPYLRSANVTHGRLLLDDVKTMSFDAKQRAKYALQPGDVLVSEGSASADAVGAPSRFSGELHGTVCFQNTLLRYRAVSDVTTPEFVSQWCSWAYESGAFRDAANGTNIKHIGSGGASRMRVAAVPLDEQDLLTSELAAAETAVERARTTVTILRDLRSNLLTALLSGEHPIPESYDEVMEDVAA